TVPSTTAVARANTPINLLTGDFMLTKSAGPLGPLTDFSDTQNGREVEEGKQKNRRDPRDFALGPPAGAINACGRTARLRRRAGRAGLRREWRRGPGRAPARAGRTTA